MSMNHHGDEERQSELLRMLQEQKDAVAKRRWPEGRLNGDDDGELAFGIGPDETGKLVKIDFGKPVTWTAMPPQQAIELAQLLIKHARAVATEPLKFVLH